MIGFILFLHYTDLYISEGHSLERFENFINIISKQKGWFFFRIVYKICILFFFVNTSLLLLFFVLRNLGKLYTVKHDDIRELNVLRFLLVEVHQW